MPVVPEGPTELEPVLPDVPPEGAPDMPAPLPAVESVVLPAVPPPVPPIVPLLPDVPPEVPAAPVAPAAPAPALSDVAPGAVVLPVLPDMPDPVVDPPDIEPPLEPVLPVDGEAVVLGVVLTVVDAPGDVVSAVRRSQPATTAVSAAVASMSFVSLDIDCIEISLIFKWDVCYAVLPGRVDSTVANDHHRRTVRQNCRPPNYTREY